MNEEFCIAENANSLSTSYAIFDAFDSQAVIKAIISSVCYLIILSPSSRSVQLNAEPTSILARIDGSRESVWRDPWHYALSIVYLCRGTIYQTLRDFKELLSGAYRLFSPRIAATFVHAECERSARVCAELRYPGPREGYVNRNTRTVTQSEPRGWRARVRLCVAFNGRWRKLRVCSRTITQRIE